ncbi:hypothetical protein BCR42DRAFT_359299 [Absidia repens]|uniref:Uncharacterized protein n=1 Tax=Absidia repens TaxID=90262 RepID=A0A1X2I5K5_9FUNG|nr:hypothetical protein BCR42DRAFT_359299 [Absidia repens]
MPFRCKCGRTFEKPDTFSTHTSGCAPFHQRRSTSSSPPSSSSLQAQAQTSPSSKVAPLEMSRVLFMPTALSIQNAFEGVRRRSLSYSASLK